MREVDQNMISFFLRDGFNTIDSETEIVIGYLGNNDGNRFAFCFPQAACMWVGLVIQFIRQRNDAFLRFLTDIMTVAQRL